MKTADPAASMYRILRLIQEINLVASTFDSIEGIDQGVFRELSLPIPILAPAELGFVRAVSWLRALYLEAGKPNVDFLGHRLMAYGLDPDGRLCGHLRTVDNLRTFAQHHVDTVRSHGRRIREHCELWFLESCGTHHPGHDGEWEDCLASLLGEAEAFLEALLKCTRCVERDDSQEEILREWDFRRKRYHPPYEFDALILEVASDMGRSAIDHVRLRAHFYDQWCAELSLLSADYDFRREARKLVEHSLLHATTPLLPITGHDIIERLGIEPGPEVGQLLKRARTLYDQSPCATEELLERLQTEMVCRSQSTL